MPEKLDYNALEKAQAKKDGATLVKNSGRGQRKGDARLYNMMLDYKFTVSASYSISVKDWKKHEVDAWAEGLEPVIIPIFLEHNHKEVAIVDWGYLKQLHADLQAYMEAENE